MRNRKLATTTRGLERQLRVVNEQLSMVQYSTRPNEKLEAELLEFKGKVIDALDELDGSSSKEPMAYEDLKPRSRQVHNFEMSYYREEDRQEDPDPDDVIYSYLQEEERDIGSDDLYSDLLDCLVAGLDLFALNPLWSNGQDGFDKFEELLEQEVIFNEDKAREGFEKIKEGVVAIMEGFDFDG